MKYTCKVTVEIATDDTTPADVEFLLGMQFKAQIFPGIKVIDVHFDEITLKEA